MKRDPDATRISKGQRVENAWLPIAFFLLVSAVASPLLASIQERSALSEDLVVLTTFATAFGAVATWLVWRRRWTLPALQVHGYVRPLTASVALAALVGVILFVAQAAESHRWPFLSPSTLGVPLTLALITQFIGVAGEEVGWRGLVQPLLETRMKWLSASITTGLFFGLGHFYVISAGLDVYALFVLSAVGLSIMLGLLTTGRSIRQRVVIATVLHWLVNVVTLVGFSDGDESMIWVANMAVATCLAALVAYSVRHKNRQERTP